MLCNVCKDGLEGVWDPSRSKRLALLKDFKIDKRDNNNEENGGGGEAAGLRDAGKHKRTFFGSKRLALLKDSIIDKRVINNEENGGGGKAAGLSNAGTDDLTRHGAFDYVYGHHKDRASFLASIQEGCAMCHQLRRRSPALIDDENPQLQTLGYFSVFYLELESQGLHANKPMMTVEVRNSRGGVEFRGGSWFFPVGLTRDNMNFDFGPSNHDPKAWSIMETWMSTCVNSHPQCSLPKTSISYRPTRLLKVDSSQRFRLVLGTECPPTLQYVALSHSWGKKPVELLLRLLQSTFEDLSRAQPVQNLPKTFRDAIDVAQHFGIDYIWIDRLCIFQDSAEDWQKEASTMQDVYRNAQFSICALGSEDSDTGCFFERDPTKVAPTIVSFKLSEDGEEKEFRAGFEKGRSWQLSFENEPLVQRSWVVQERLLAPRTLHFGSKQLFWECREASCCEMHPESVFCFKDDDDGDNGGAAGDRQKSDHPFLWKQLLDAPDQRHTSDPYEQLFTDWNMLIGYYVSRQLTVSNDKLIALSGMANDMKARLQQLRPGPHRYLAGLWEEKLMNTLMWSVTVPAKRASQYRAPSWSWACLDGQLNTYGCQDGEMISFTSMVSVDMTYLGKEDTGMVDGGILTLAGPCAPAEIDLEKKSHHTFESERDVRSIRGDDGSDLYKNDETKVKIVFDTLHDLTEQIVLIWVCAHRFYGEQWFGHGLALAHVEGDKYHRLGMVDCWFDTKDDAQVFSARFPQKQIRII